MAKVEGQAALEVESSPNYCKLIAALCCQHCFPSVSGSALLGFPCNLWWELSHIPEGYLYAQWDQGVCKVTIPNARTVQWMSEEWDGTGRAPSLMVGLGDLRDLFQP